MNSQISPTDEVLPELITGIRQECQWLQSIIAYRLEHTDAPNIFEILPVPEIGEGVWQQLIEQFDLTPEERLISMLALAPYINPGLLSALTDAVNTYSYLGQFIGGLNGVAFKGFIPTIDTALFLMCGIDHAERISSFTHFQPTGKLLLEHLIKIKPVNDKEPRGSYILQPTDETLSFLTGESTKFAPVFSMSFPAEHLTTQQSWDDLVLSLDNLSQVTEITEWIDSRDILLANPTFAKKHNKGYKVLFHGPPGTGKTFTATLLGKKTGKDVYRIDLSMMISKYIGETEKNLAKIFDRARHKDWILFFDEADALFGKRTETKDSHDRYANQEVSYLLQKIEEFDGIVILSSNFKGNIDSAFNRRFNSVIFFQPPDAEMRSKLWEQSIPEGFVYEGAIKLRELGKNVKLTGATIQNVIRYCCMKSQVAGVNEIRVSDLERAIRKEFEKEGKTV